jgi:hypothetical protein
MANHSITNAQYQALIESYRKDPGNVTQAARIAGCSRLTARRGWTDGWPLLARAPIQQIIREEQMHARAAMADEAAKQAAMDAVQRAEEARSDARRAREDVLRTRKQEAELVRALRGNVGALIGITGHALRGMLDQARTIEADIRSGLDPSTGKSYRLQERVRMMDALARIVQRASESAAEVVRMERLLLGEPTEIIGAATSTIEDVVREFEATNRAVQRVVRGGLVAIPGGKDQGVG